MVEADIFISHKDMKIINSLVEWLNEKFKVDVFVDSYILAYCNDLLKSIDEEYFRHFNETSL